MIITNNPTQGQLLSTQNRGKLLDNICQFYEKQDFFAEASGSSSDFSRKTIEIDGNSSNFEHRVDDFDKNHDIYVENSSKTQKTTGLIGFSSPVDPKNNQNLLKSDHSTGLLDKNEQNDGSLDEKAEKSASSPDFTGKSEESKDLFDNTTHDDAENAENQAKTSIPPSFEEQISRDYGEFSKLYPNVSMDSLTSDKNLRLFALGKENQPFVSVYKDFCALVDAIELRVLKQSAHRLSVEKSSVGALSSAKFSDDGYFTREQVQRMSKEEIRRNYTRIRESQARW